MEPSELLRFVTRVLEKLELRYFVTGSAATIFYGEPRFTNDIDIVLDLPPGRVSELCAAFPADEFYISEESWRFRCCHALWCRWSCRFHSCLAKWSSPKQRWSLTGQTAISCLD